MNGWLRLTRQSDGLILWVQISHIVSLYDAFHDQGRKGSIVQFSEDEHYFAVNESADEIMAQISKLQAGEALNNAWR